MPNVDPEQSARNAFLASYRDDLARGQLANLSDYQRRFPGFEEAIAKEWAWLEPGEASRGTPPRPGAIGPYGILAELGRGAQATVYLAEHRALGRRVALKVLHRALLSGDPLARLRFRREAIAAANVEHPSICSIYETGNNDGAAWIAMQYVPGKTLAAYLQERDQPAGDRPPVSLCLPGAPNGDARAQTTRLLMYFEQAARALHVAHERGFVHRDIKPQNLMVHEGGHPVVLDFGLARHDQEGFDGLGLTRSHDVLGTPYYLAPEQLQDDTPAIDHRVDVWALGVTLYECLTGRRPFDAASRDGLYRQILTTDPPAIRTITADLPRDLDVLLRTALEKDLSHRYGSALDLAEDLCRVRLGEPIAAKPISAVGRISRWARRNRKVAVSATIALLSLLAGMIVSLVLLQSANAALERERAVRAVRYDEVSRMVAFDDVHGRMSLMLGRLRIYAVATIDERVPGFRVRFESIVARGTAKDKLRTTLASSTVLLESLDQLDPPSRLSAADLLQQSSRRLLGIRGNAEFASPAIVFADTTLRLLRAVTPTDIRVVRARILTLDARMQRGTPDDYRWVAAKARAWRDSCRGSGNPNHDLHAALFATRLGGALTELEDLDGARTALSTSVDLVDSVYPGSWFANAALANHAALQDALAGQGHTEAQQQPARLRLAESLAATVDITPIHTHYGLREVRIAFGPERHAAWLWLMGSKRLSSSPMTDSAVNGLLRQLHEVLARHVPVQDDPIVHQLGRALQQAAENQLNTSESGKAARIGRLYESCIELLERRHDGERPRNDNYTPLALSRGAYCFHLVQLGKFEEAEESVKAAIKIVPPESFVRPFVDGALGNCLAKQARFEAAQPLLIHSYEVLREWLGPYDGNVRNRMRMLSKMYRDWGRPESQRIWDEELAALPGR